MELTREYFERLARDTWLRNLSPDPHRSLSVLWKFRNEMGLNPYTLLFDARRKQDTTEIDEALQAFHERCITLGLTEATAKQYLVVLRGFFQANRVDVRKGPKKMYWKRY